MMRLAGLLGLITTLFQGPAPGPAGPPPVIESVRAHHRGMAVWWMGNAGWLVKSNDTLISFDLELSLGQRLQPTVATPADLASEIDVAFVSHHHTDHCNPATIRALAAGTRTTLVLPSQCVKIVPNLGLAPERLVVPEPLKPFDVKGVHVEPIHAIHGNQEFTILTREADFVESIRTNCGYVVTLGGKRILHPGDSILTEEHIGLKNIDVQFVSPTVHNMHVDRSSILINRLQPSFIFPQHFGTYRETDTNRFWTRGYPEELKERLSADLQARYHQLKIGDRFVIQ
jgi:L-ascorbate metabolism protein UlaG (beta-lactamase superfamily)